MLPLFTNPLAFLALASVPALVAVYWLRTRFRRHPVSSLVLWLDHPEVREGGIRLNRFQAPLPFFLELLALLLLTLAAADPHVPAREGTRPLIVVLDDSYSMLAGAPDSPRARAAAALHEELKRHPRPSVRLLLAGPSPQFLGDPLHAAAELPPLLEQWRCRAPTARLDKALALAAESGGDQSLILLLTDQAPVTPPEKGRTQWWAFGRPLPNLAFVNAVRAARDGRDRCLFEVANLSASPRGTSLIIRAADTLLREVKLDLAAGETRRVILDLRQNTPALRATIGDDDLAIDNEVILLPVAHRPVHVDLRIADETLRSLVDKALRSTRMTVADPDHPDLLVTDTDPASSRRPAPARDSQAPPPTATDLWTVRFHSAARAEAYTGPFVLDHSHPLAEGLALQGAVWGAGPDDRFPGAPVLSAGNVPLLNDREDPDGAHELHIAFRPDLSTLQTSPNWPILFWNLAQWNASLAPGVGRPNLRLGEDATVRFRSAHETADVTLPTGEKRPLPVIGKQLTIHSDDVGTFTVDAGDEHYFLTAAALRPDESDLSRAQSGRWGNWLDETLLHEEYRSITWLLLLLALGVLALHMLLLRRGGATNQP